MQVSQVNRYIIKSGAAEPLEHAEIALRGIPYDRHWMVASESGEYISQRQKGMQKLSLVSARLEDEFVRISAPGMADLLLALDANTGKRVDVVLHGKTYPAIDEGPAASAWISSYLPSYKRQSLKIVHFPSDFVRDLRSQYTDAPTAQTEFADGYPILLCSEESLAELNARLLARGEEEVSLDRFRPNFIIKGLAPFREDEFKVVQVGSESGPLLEIVKPCARCPITGVIQDEGKFSTKPTEPRATLEEFHSGAHVKHLYPNLDEDLLDQPMFGVNAILLRPGIVHTGDEVEVVSRR